MISSFFNVPSTEKSLNLVVLIGLEQRRLQQTYKRELKKNLLSFFCCCYILGLPIFLPKRRNKTVLIHR